MTKIKKTILISGGKGGTGKTTLSANLGLVLAEQTTRIRKRKYQVAILDCDIETANLSYHLGVERRLSLKEGKLEPITIKDNLKIMSVANWAETKGVALDEGSKLQWLKECINYIDWGSSIDILVCDLASAASSELLTLNSLLKNVEGLILVLNDDRSTINDGEGTIEISIHNKIPILGIVGNMIGTETMHGQYAVCSCGCGCEFNPFGSGDRVRDLCKKYGIDYLGSIPLSEKVKKKIQNGEPSLPPNSKVIQNILRKVL